MQNRREFLIKAGRSVLSAAVLTTASPGLARDQTPEGFAYQDWFQATTFDLRADLEAAENSKKMLVLLWEQRGCYYCKQMHEVAFARKDIVDLIVANFHVVQMDLRGQREFIDLEGQKMSEARIANGNFVNATPTTQFIDDIGSEVFRIPGYAEPKLFKAAYQYVVEGAYNRGSFQKWVEKRDTR